MDDYYPSGYTCIPQTGMNAIASRDQFKPIRVREDLVVNYNENSASIEAAC